MAMDRRQFLRVVGLGSVAVAAPTTLVGTAAASTVGLTNAGIGIYSDLSVASQLSTFTIEKCRVTCGVGTFGVDGQSGPFAMLMYSLVINSFEVDDPLGRPGTLTATGTMRSITMTGNFVQEEDAEHEFLAIGVDNRGVIPDRFDIHFKTDFWSRDNPMATPSDEGDDLVRFGGPVIRNLSPGRQVGGVNVGRG